MSNSITVALKLTERKSTTKLTRFEHLGLHKDWSEANDGMVLYKTDIRFAVQNRVDIEKVILYLNEEVAYLVDVVTVGLSGVTKVPEGFNSTDFFKGTKSKFWLALNGKFNPINTYDYTINSSELPMVAAFELGGQSRTYVHKA